MSDQHPDLFDLVPSEPAKAGDASGMTPIVATIVVFPLRARVGKIRDVARKLLATKSDRHAAHYRAQIDHALRVSMAAKHVPTELHASEIVAFWREVEFECARILHHGREQA